MKMPKPSKYEIDVWIKEQKIGTRFQAKMLHRDLLKYGISRSTVNRHLCTLSNEGTIKKCNVSVGRNQEWIIVSHAMYYS